METITEPITEPTLSQTVTPVIEVIEENIFVAKVENNALLDAPVYESHKRGKNWMAVITCDPASPGGYARNFCKRGNGVYYYIVDQTIVGKSVEFGADYYSCGGNKTAERFYGVVLSLNSEIRIREYNTGRQACKAAEITTGTNDQATLITEREKILTRLAEINLILGDEVYE